MPPGRGLILLVLRKTAQLLRRSLANGIGEQESRLNIAQECENGSIIFQIF